MPSPVTHRFHSNPHYNLIGWLSAYTNSTMGVEGAKRYSPLDLHNMPQPDAYLIIMPTHGGQVRIDEKGYIVGARSWSPRCPPPPPASICTLNSKPIGETASASILFRTGVRPGNRLVRAAE